MSISPRPLTERQQRVLDFIRQSIVDRGHPPTLREIGAKFGINSNNGVDNHLRALERKGFLIRALKKSRGISLVASDAKVSDVWRAENERLRLLLERAERVLSEPILLGDIRDALGRAAR